MSELEGTGLERAGSRLEATETDDLCPHCGGPVLLSLKYDAMFCPACDLWLEERCNDPGCVYCARRPQRPSQG